MLHLTFPALGTIAYINIPKQRLESIPNNYIVIFSFFHNLLLHIFSLYIFSNLITEIIINGAIVEKNYYCSKPHIKRLLFYFYISKYYEYIDTMILYAKGKKPIFLQKFHHIGAVVVWHLGYMYRFDGVFYASLINSGVHTIMYFYYLLSLLPNTNQYIRKYKVYITSIQVAQLAYGAAALPLYYYPIETDVNKNVILTFDLYICCLIILFLHFMLKNYL
jgi:GNS1/SUR4 family